MLTVDIEDREAVTEALEKIINSQVIFYASLTLIQVDAFVESALPCDHLVHFQTTSGFWTAFEKIILNKNSFFLQPSPYLPFEFTHEGMLERVNALIHNQVLAVENKCIEVFLVEKSRFLNFCTRIHMIGLL